MTSQDSVHLAYFISAHGFGHAARATAVMTAIQRKLPKVHFDIFTLVPGWFFAESLPPLSFTVFPEKTDIGLIQKTPMEQDITATLAALDSFLPFDPSNISRLAQKILRRSCQAVICDISPLGIVTAATAQLPSILIENFTWDWIYEEYSSTHPGFRKHIDYLKEVFSTAQHHIQTEPVCETNANAALTTFPVSRQPYQNAQEVRTRLKIPSGEKVALLTMGGIPEDFKNLERLQDNKACYFIVPGGHSDYCWKNRLVLIPHHSAFYHPDLINASDVVIGKAGYSTIAEVYHAGIPFGYISRSNFREAPPMEYFIQQNIQAIGISEDSYRKNQWVKILPALLAAPRIKRSVPNGADQIADFIGPLIEQSR
ncbi:MAG: hypothetical protein IT308_11560 [Anaerolineaceae bacterium]|nr:hypothetical protein [Anaerolineaceae bacterium]